MYRPTLLILTDLANGDADEDVEIAEFLRQHFRIYFAHPSDSSRLENEVTAIIIRNIWNPRKYGQPEPWYARWYQNTSLPLHDDLYRWRGSQKAYLVELYNAGYPVIPTVDSLADLNRIPPATSYFIKPADGFDAINTKRVSLDELRNTQTSGYLIQPFVDFEQECSFYYLDGSLQYALYTPDKTERWNLIEFKPS